MGQPMGAVIIQPREQVVVQAGPKPKDHLIFSILTMILCQFIFGGIALLFSIMSRNRWRENNVIDATKFSQFSFIMNIVALVAGSLTWITVIVITIWRIVAAVMFATAVTSSVNVYS
jgi:hypothetical protein